MARRRPQLGMTRAQHVSSATEGLRRMANALGRGLRAKSCREMFEQYDVASRHSAVVLFNEVSLPRRGKHASETRGVEQLHRQARADLRELHDRFTDRCLIKRG